ncbi:MAG: helical backbone metal receptor [Candidatus Latescibacter sp.]|nr:helical backbone metal receptor [Candidatus Latescibacter sp.]
MNRTLFILILVFCALLLTGIGCRKGDAPESAIPAGKNYTRIISLAPSITETLFALGLGDRVIGVTKFCKYPPEAREKAQVGGFFDPNYEAVVTLKPDLVILLPEHEQARKYLENLGIATLVVHNRVIGEILDTITVIGKTCGAEKEAERIVRDIESRKGAVQKKTAGRERRRVIVAVGRTAGALDQVFIAGPNTFYDELIALAGGTNAYRGYPIPYPEVSGEGMLRLDPEIILDLLPELAEQGHSEAAARSDWNKIHELSAVKNRKVYILTADYAVIPGPRFIQTLEEMARIIHPEVEWK